MKKFERLLSGLLVFCMILAMIPAEAFAEERNPGVLTTDIGSKFFAVGVPTEFTFTTTANDDAGKMVKGSFVFSDPGAIGKLEYLESKDGNWYEFYGDFGPASGFPMIDGTSHFRVTFSKAGEFTLSVAMKMADGSGEVCSTKATVTVSDHKPSQIVTDIPQKEFKVGQVTEFVFGTIANDDAGKMVVGSAVFSDPDAIAKLEYLETKDGQWYELKGDFGPASGFPMSDAQSRFRVTFAKPGNYSFTAYMKSVENGEVLCYVQESFVVADKTPAVITTDISGKTFVAGETTVFTFTTTANDFAGTMVVGSAVFSDPNAIEKLEYLETKDGNWYELKGDFGPAGGFPLMDATSTFRVTFKNAGNYTVAASMKFAQTGEVLCTTGEIAVNVLARYNVTVSTNNAQAGTISPSAQMSVLQGQSAVFQVAANEGYQIESIGGATKVELSEDKMTATVTVVPESDVTVVVNFVKTFTVKVTHNENGTIVADPSLIGGSVKVVTGSDVKITATPNAGYRVSAVEIKSGSEVIESRGFDVHAFVYETTLAMDKDYEIIVTFAESLYDITIAETENGTVTIDDADGIIEHGGNTIMTVVADAENGYRISSVTINGVAVEVDAEGKYVLSDIREDKTIVAVFELIPYEVKVITNGHGTVNVPETVIHGSDLSVSIVPEPGYRVSSIKINGEKIEDYEIRDYETLALGFELKEIKAAQNIDVTFVAKSEITDEITDLFDETQAKRIDGMKFIYAPGSQITFSTDKAGIMIYGGNTLLAGGRDQKTATVDAGTNITKIVIWDKTAGFPDWNIVTGISVENPLMLLVDEAPAQAVITPTEANANGYYNSDVPITIQVEDPGDYTGIASIEAWVVMDGVAYESKVIYSSDTRASRWEGTYVVDASKYNSDNVVVCFKVTDHADNPSEYQTDVLKINSTAPVLTAVEITDDVEPEAMDGYYKKRIVEITIVDRATTFDAEAAKNGVQIQCSNAMPLSLTPSMISCTSENDVHKLTIEFVDDGRYEWSFAYKNKADMEVVNAEDLAVVADAYQFVVDGTAPEGKLHYETDTWSELLETLTFGIWSNVKMVVTAEGRDATSPVKAIAYYKANGTNAMTEGYLKDQYQAGNFTEEAYEISSNETFVVYARIVDYAGNVTYIGTDGMIFDNVDSTITVTARDENKNEWTDENGTTVVIYNGNVKVDVQVAEDSADYSGIKSIDYMVVRDGDMENPTQSGNLYTFEVDNDVNPTYGQLKKEWSTAELEEQCITVDAELNNSDNVKVVIIVVDNAGNEVRRELPLAINIDVLSASVEFAEQAAATADDRGYFSVENRVATITITNDRGSSFDMAKATAGISVTAVDANGKPVENAYEIGEWESDGTKHSVKVTFKEDANYTWSFSYQNKAGNVLDVESNLSTGESENPFNFTVDDTNPTGRVEINENTWENLLDILTFGLFSNNSFTVEAYAEDKTSPVKIQYYKTDCIEHLDIEALEAAEFVDYGEEYSLTIAENERFVVYHKITDLAGNYIYLNSDGAIVDKNKAQIELTQTNEDGIYGIADENPVVKVAVIDPEIYSGIKSIEYWIVKDGEKAEEDVLYTFETVTGAHGELLDTWSGDIEVDKDKYNSSDVVVYVKVIDNAGNVSEKNIKLDIDITAPTVAVSIDYNGARNDRYFNVDHTATITITERTNHFDSQDAPASIVNAIIAKNALGEAVDGAYEIGKWTTVEGATPDAATHTVTVNFVGNANYTVDMSYMDKVGNTGTDESHAFTVDKVNPYGEIKATAGEGHELTWDRLIADLRFGFWSGEKITITGTAGDAVSPIESVSYYKHNGDAALTMGDLSKVEWKKFEKFEVLPNEQFAVYLRIVDNAGNITYISTNGLIVDNENPREEAVAPMVTIEPQQPVNGIYNGDVRVSIKVVDPLNGATASGLSSVVYRVYNMGKLTQEETLYSFDNENPVKNDLELTFETEILVQSSINNSNDIRIEVIAMDNAGNTSVENDVTIKIDTTKPKIDVTYNNNNPDSEKYYKADRKATITVTERNLNLEDIKIVVTKDGKAWSGYEITKWTTDAGSGNQDNATHTATITYKNDGDYTFDISCTDHAGNKNVSVDYGNSRNPREFTIDKTNPVIRVSYSNNQQADDGYFKVARTATITITEHNFKQDRVVFTRETARGGVLPNIGWTHNGDTHTATISYTTDGDYTFDVTMTDLAGNSSGAADYGNSVAGKDFVIDTTYTEMITIGGVEDGKAYGYGETVIPSLNISDINLKNYTVTLTGVQKGATIDLTEKVNTMLNAGTETVNGTFDIFESAQELDGIYTLNVTSLDKAGNADEAIITFTINRYGSVYQYGKYLMNLIANGGAYVTDVTEDLVIDEYNADKLLSNSLDIEITCDGKPLENVIYEATPEINDRVNIGESGWYQYRYVISKENFTSDGVYKITVSSEDATGNKPENNDYADLGITFRVDSTLAEISSIVGLEEPIVNATEQRVKYTVYDTMGIKAIRVYVNGELIDEITDFGEDFNNYNGSFTLSEQSSAQSIRIVVEDMSGNITDTAAEAFVSAYTFHDSVTVSTNAFVRWYANKALFWGSIGGTFAVVSGLWYLLASKHKKKEEATK